MELKGTKGGVLYEKKNIPFIKMGYHMYVSVNTEEKKSFLEECLETLNQNKDKN